MDIKTRILRWEHRIEEDPAVLVLWIIVTLAVIFIGMIFFDAYRKQRKQKRRSKRD